MSKAGRILLLKMGSVTKTVLAFFIMIVCASINGFGQNQNLSGGTVFDGEPYLAIDPNNSHHLVVAWLGYAPLKKFIIKVRASFDAGQTWSEPVPIPHSTSRFTSADASLGFDAAGKVYLAYIDYDPRFIAGAVYVRQSTDGGLSWGDATEVINMASDPGKRPIDRPWMVIDQSAGSHRGNIYLTTMTAKGASAPFHPYFIKSTDQGDSWSPWRYADTTGWLAGSIIPQPMASPAVAANGTFHCVYSSWVLRQNLAPQYILASSADAGRHFTYHTVFASSEVFSDSLAKKGYLLRADPANARHLAFFYLAAPHGDADVFMRESFDAGAGWSEPVRINDDPAGNDRMQDLLWADFDRSGDLMVAWRDRRDAPDSGYASSSAIWGAFRSRDSSHFSANFQISDTIVAYDSVLAAAGNDFMCVRLREDTLYAVWGDVRTGKMNIWYQRMAVPSGAVVSARPLSSETIPTSPQLSQNYPNPFSPAKAILHSSGKNAGASARRRMAQTIIRYRLTESGEVRLVIYDILGRTVRTLVQQRQPAGSYAIPWDGRNETGEPVPVGVYFYRLSVNAKFQLIKKMLLQ